MANIFFISDTHWGHESCCTKFKRADGSPLRPFANAQEMDEEMVRRWNERVKPDDKVYHLGDVAINKTHLPTMDRCNGNKILIHGNHDPYLKLYPLYFKKMYGIRILEDIVLTHVPLHPASVTQRWGTNVHGHLHANIVERVINRPETRSDREGLYQVDNYVVEPDPLYLNVSVEQIDYTPIEYSELRALIAKRREQYGTPDYGAYVHKK